MCSCSVSQTKLTQHTQEKKLFRRYLFTYTCNFLRKPEVPIEGYEVNLLWQFVLKIEDDLKNDSLHLVDCSVPPLEKAFILAF